jgi:hypothetical protein
MTTAGIPSRAWTIYNMRIKLQSNAHCQKRELLNYNLVCPRFVLHLCQSVFVTCAEVQTIEDV